MSGILESMSTPPALPSHEVDAAILVKGLAVVVCTYNRSSSLRRFLQSLAIQDYKPGQVIVVDASTTDDTSQMLRDYPDIENLADRFEYFRVSRAVRGLTRQRNFGVRRVTNDLVAFFDDDIVLMPGCLREMERVHRSLGDKVAGVCALIQIGPQSESERWREMRYGRRYFGLLRFFRAIPTLRPGTYERSGFNVPWGLLTETEELIEGQWLPGGVTMWKTAVVREVRFDEYFHGYGLAEDLDFSLRAREKGKLLLAGAARVQHLNDSGGRLDPYDLGYMQIRNLYRIHQRALADRKWTDVAWFIYAWTIESLMLLTRYLFSPRWAVWHLKLTAGRIRAGCDIVWGSWTSKTGKPFKAHSSNGGKLNP